MRVSIRSVGAMSACVAVLITAAGCGDSKSDGSSSGGGSSAAKQAVAGAQKSLAGLKTKVYGKGPNGESPAAASSIRLDPAELAKIKGMGAKPAIVRHYAREHRA